MPILASQELYSSLMEPPRFVLEVNAPMKATLFLKMPTEIDDVSSLPTPSILKSVPLWYDVLL